MADSNVFLTSLRLKELKNELKYLKSIKEPELAQQIKEARELGNLDDNSEFDRSLEELALVTKRINELENILSRAVIIKSSKKGEKTVSLGSKVIVEVDGRKDSFTILGEEEADPTKGFISNKSPVGKALLGAKLGQEVYVETGFLSVVYKILDVINE